MSAWRKLSVAVLASTVLAGGAVACSSSSNDSGTTHQGSALDLLSPAQLAKAAAKEGSLTWYTTFSDSDVAPIVAAFNKAYPNIKVNPVRLSADDIPPRMFSEQKAGKYNVDVVSGDAPQIAQLLQADALQPYTPTDVEVLPEGLDLPQGYEGVVYAVTTVIAYNPTVVQQKGLPVPKSWDDLAQPAWKGQFSIDPGAVNWYDALVREMGHDKALAVLKGLGANDPKFVESHTSAITQVQSGEQAAAATAYGYKSASLKKKTPDKVEFVNPDPLPSSLTLIDLAKKAPHPAAARLFENWMVSKPGQTSVVDITNHTSIRIDVTNDPSVWDEKKWHPAWGAPNLSSQRYNKELSEMKAALRAP